MGESEIMRRILDAVAWEPVPCPPAPEEDNLPYVTHQGVMAIGDMRIRVYTLSDGQRIMDAEDFLGWLDRLAMAGMPDPCADGGNDGSHVA